MSETVKLIIEIDKDIYKARQHWVANPRRAVDEVDIAIANGIPLEEIRTEIIELPLRLIEGHFLIDHDSVLKILDNIGKGE